MSLGTLISNADGTGLPANGLVFIYASIALFIRYRQKQEI
ncbi:hypothetical protein SFMTTN_1418 [Sulfuriferula multivorans]|uniref:Uncharacterized protein n=1 Tax=Sulfuriferula multivorans TaxID=1559896 RepID=A0A401JD61_9PROT|nr:hypothetical protein SFMTTN_1418 [Sulfuriferula multivorans]